jgi:predicted Zn-dependent protease
MKTALTLTTLALALACSGCKTVSPLLTQSLQNMNLQDVQNVMAKGQQLVQGQRDLSEPEEIALGAGIASNMLGAAPLWQDKKAQQYVNQVGQWLAKQTERADLPWHFAVLDDAEFNAFAAPGGYIFITRGLLQSMRSEAELAGVLSHEIAHVVRKHHLLAIKSAANQALYTEIGGKVLTMAPQASSLNSKINQYPWVKNWASAGMQVFVRGLDKSDEFEADRMGVVIAARAGYDPYGLPASLQTLQTMNPAADGLTLMFKTHPAFAERLDMLNRVMGPEFDKFEHQPALAARFKANVAMPKAK